MLTPLNSVLATANSSLDILSLDPLGIDPLPPDSRQRLLRFPLDAQESVLLSLNYVAEVLKIEPSDILPVPEVVNCVMGVCHWRGEMVWLINLCELLGYPSGWSTAQPSSLMMIVIQADGRSLGLGVPQVNDIELHDLDQLQAIVPGLFSPQLLPFVLGVLPQESSAVLNVSAILHCALWQQQWEGQT